jgi:hypothetical protein
MLLGTLPGRGRETILSGGEDAMNFLAASRVFCCRGVSMSRLFAVGLLVAMCMATVLPAYADRDEVQFFSNIESTPESPVHDAVCFFCSVHVKGYLGGDIVVFFGNISIDGQAHRDVVSFFSNVHIADNASIGRDMVTLFGNVRLGENASVDRDMVSIFGAQHLAGSARVGRDRVRIPAIIFWGPFLFLIAIVVLVVHEVRSRHRRWPAPGYPPPGPVR